jgi:hypothetical protein
MGSECRVSVAVAYLGLAGEVLRRQRERQAAASPAARTRMETTA